MSQQAPRLLPVGRVSGHRGARGELTVRVFRGEASRWTGMSRIRLERPGSGGDGRDYTVESDRAYRDRLVLKLAGVDDANSAAGLRGLELLVREDLAPRLPDGEHHPEALIGLEVIDLTTGRLVGRVRDVIPTGAADLLVIVADPRASRDEEILVPQVADIVRSVDLEAGRIEILPPEDLLDLNRR